MMKKLALVLAVGVISLLLVACPATETPATSTYTASLTGAAEVPPVTTNATGSVTVTLDGNAVTVEGSYSGLSGAPTGAHIHGPASETENAGVILALTATDGTTAGTGTISGSGNLSDAEVADLKAGRYYVNVHTEANAPGEIRGQLE